MLHVMCARCAAHDLHMTVHWPPEVHVGDSLWCGEEMVKILNCAFQCDGDDGDDDDADDDDYVEGSRPEWSISSIIYSGDTPFWLETPNM